MADNDHDWRDDLQDAVEDLQDKAYNTLDPDAQGGGVSALRLQLLQQGL